MRFYDLDIDVKNYAKRIIDAGNPIPADIEAVSDFIKGLKTNNLYHSVADMWFLRLGQNVNSGTISYALKNQANICTLVNGPTRDQNGIKTLSASSQYLEIITPEILDNFTVAFIGSNTISNTTNTIFNFQRYRNIYSADTVSLDFLNTTSLRAFSRTSGVTTTLSPADSSYGSSSFSFQGFAISHDVSSNTFRYRRGASIVTNATTPRTKVLFKNRIYAPTRDENGNGAFVTFSNFIFSAFFVFSTNVDDSWNNIYNIYKTTAGKGLGLP